MRRAALLLLLTAAARGETIEGVVSGPQGPMERAELRVRAVGGAAQDAVTRADGKYRFTVTPGSYDLYVVKTGYGSVAKRAVTVARGAAVRMDIPLEPTINLGTPGEYPALELRNRAKILTGRVPRTANGKPDLSGIWLPSQPIESEEPQMKPWAAALTRERSAGGGASDPRTWCLPSGTVRTNHSDLTKFVQTPDLLVILIEAAPPNFRQVFLKPDVKHPVDSEPTWMGHSIGRWDGDVLVVDTVGFHDRGWIDGSGRPQTEQLHVIERFKRTSKGTMEVTITVDDPGAYEKPWTFHRLLWLTESEELLEAICNENQKPEHYVEKSVLQ